MFKRKNKFLIITMVFTFVSLFSNHSLIVNAKTQDEGGVVLTQLSEYAEEPVETFKPTEEPTLEQTALPTIEPTALPTTEPTVAPTTIPTIEPTVTPTTIPTLKPTIKPTEKPVKPIHVVKTGKEYSYSNTKNDLKKLAKHYDKIMKLSVAGKSLEDRNIYLLKLGTGKKKVFIVGAVHAREYVTANYVMKEVDQLAYSYYSKSGKFGNYNIKDLLNKVTLYIIPMANPDGVNIVQNGYQSSKYASLIKKKLNGKSSKSWKANARGVDINRNFPQWWSKGEKAIRGPKPLSEPESKIIYNLYNSNNFSATAVFHTKGQIIYWMDSSQAKYYNKMYPYAKKFSNMTGYSLVNYKTEGVFCGGVLDYIKKKTPSKPSYTFELCKSVGSSEIPFKDSKFDKELWSRAKYIIPELLVIGTKN